MNIECLQGSFPATEHPGLDSTDPRFTDIATLSQDGRHEEAAELCEALIAEGIYDIRLICFFLYGYWLENGLASLLPVVGSLNNVLGENWQAVGPEGNLTTSLEKSLDWLLRQILKKLQYEESKKSPLWHEWQAAAETVEVGEILAAGEQLQAGLNQRHPDKAAVLIAQWSKIEQWLAGFSRLAESAPDEPEDTETLSEPEAIDDKPAGTDYAITLSAQDSTILTIETSYHMAVLLKKLAAFEHVIKENKFPQAALLAEDINHTLATFDPKLYFPKLFETFVRLQVVNFEALTAYADLQEDPQWQAMQEWLKVDLDSFIKH